MGLGNTVGFHRLLTHRSFETHPFVRGVLTVLGALHSGSPLMWVGLHRLHHAKSDGPLDPHSPANGFWFAHSGWVIGTRNPVLSILFALTGFGQQAALLVHDIRRVLGKNPPEWRELCPDLRDLPLMRLLDVPGVIPVLFLCQLSLAWWVAGGWGLVWLWALHFTLTNGSWAVNSVCHWTAFGRQDHDNHDTSRNVPWVAFFTYGEGYHNNHHRYPRSARHALDGGWDMSWLLIRGLERCGLAWKLWLPKKYRTTPVKAAHVAQS